MVWLLVVHAVCGGKGTRTDQTDGTDRLLVVCVADAILRSAGARDDCSVLPTSL